MTTFEAIRPLLPEGLVLADELLSRHTSFKIGGPAEVYVTPENSQQMAKVWRACQEAGYAVTILGDGCNVLVSDDGIKGVVFATGRMNNIDVEGHNITAGSGTKLSRLAEAACKAGLKGLEFASGIPGTVGGAVFMNAGAYEHDIQEVCEYVEALHPDGKTVWYDKEALGFGYRASRFQNETAIITSAKFKLTPANIDEIRTEMNNLNSKRRDKQPLNYPSAGSTFKRPAQKGWYASRMIDENGLKGLTVGGAQVSEKHAGFIINKGGATAADVIALMKAVQEKIHQATGIWLEPEVQMLGFVNHPFK